jgi:hypothetical protein
MSKSGPYEFRDAQEIIERLSKNKARIDKWFAERKESLDEIVVHSVKGSTFRSFHHMPAQPSVVFRTWAMDELANRAVMQDLKDSRSQADYDNWLNQFSKRLNKTWLKQMGKPMPFGPLRKLPNLVLKQVVLWTGLSESQRGRLVRLLHVPLDSYTLIGIRRCIDDPEIPRSASMGFVAGETMYNQLQGAIRRIAAKAKVPAIYFDELAWNMMR